MHRYDFGQRLRVAREIRGMTQVALAEQVGLPAASISHFEAGRRLPCVDNLRTLANALEADVNWLLCLRAEPTPHPISTRLGRDIDAMTDRDRRFLSRMVEVLRDEAERGQEGAPR